MSDERQLNLFGEAPKPKGGRGDVGPVEPSAEQTAIAAALPKSVYLGTSSWSFPGWAGLVYDREVGQQHLARRGLAAYARHPLLRAVGIDRTYYAPISSDEFAAYAEVVPDDFRFLVKASSEITFPRRRDSPSGKFKRNELFLLPSYATDAVIGPFVEGLGNKAGPLVFQFAPLGARTTADPARFAAKLEAFLSALPRGPRYTVELRDRELATPEYYRALASAGARHCVSVHPRMRPAATQLADGGAALEGPLTARWMLRGGFNYEEAKARYEPFRELVDEDPRTRSSLAQACAEFSRAGSEVVVIANNKAEGSAPLTIFRLAEEITRRLSMLPGSPT
ncbi:MAG: DUF72 domain-containing protein [bacterium]|nr:DUF72 domain-containing protein [bacterium]